MRKYRIYSGAKPSSPDKTYAVSWGGKYFAVSPTVGKENVPDSVSATFIERLGNVYTFKCVNSGNDNVKVTLKWSVGNPDMGPGVLVSPITDLDQKILGPYTSVKYSLDFSNVVYPGTNSVSAVAFFSGLDTYQTGEKSYAAASVLVYKQFAAPVVNCIMQYSNITYNSVNKFPYGIGVMVLDPYSYSWKIANPNSCTASYYENTGQSRSGLIMAGSSVTISGGTCASESSIASNIPSIYSNKSKTYYLDSGSSAAKSQYTVSSGSSANSADVEMKAPALAACVPISSTSNFFQVTVYNDNSRRCYCRVQYNLYDKTGSDYWLADCPAKGSATMTDTSGNTKTFAFTRGAQYVLSLYFFTQTSSSLSYTGTQISRTVHYLFKAPDMGYLYSPPNFSGIAYDDDSSPTEVNFAFENPNFEGLRAEVTLVEIGAGILGSQTILIDQFDTRYCLSTWEVAAGTEYEVTCYFVDKNGSSQVSKEVTYNFTTPSNS